MNESFVTIVKKDVGSNYTYEYSVQLVGVGSKGKRGVELSNLTDLNSDKKYDFVTKTINDMTCQSISSEVLDNVCNDCCTEYR